MYKVSIIKTTHIGRMSPVVALFNTWESACIHACGFVKNHKFTVEMFTPSGQLVSYYDRLPL